MFTALASLGLATFCKAEDDPRLTKSWRAFLLSIFVWALGRALMNVSLSRDMALLWVRISYLSSIWMGPLFMWLAYELIKHPLPTKISISIGLICGTLSIFSWTPLLIADVRPKLNFSYYDVPGGITFQIFSCVYTGTIAWAHWRLLREMKKTNGIYQNRIRYFFVAGIIGFAASSTTFPLVYDKNFYPFGVPLIATYPFLVTYSVLRYQVMDLYLLLRDTTVHMLSSLLIGSIFIGISATSNDPKISFLTQIAMLLFLPALYPKASKWVRRNVNRTRLGDVDRYLDDIEEKSSSLITASFSVRSLSEATLELLTSIFPVNEASVYLMRTKTKSLYLYARKGIQNNILDISQTAKLFEILSQMHNVVSIENSEKIRIPQKEVLDQFFRESKGEVLCPIFINKQLTGLILLGPKVSQSKYHQKDLEALRFLAKKLEIACGFAMASEKYAVVMGEWSHSLNQITKPIEQKAGVIRDFIDLYSHDEIKTIAEVILKRVEQLRKVHDYITNTTALSRELITGEFKKETVNIAKLIRDCVLNYKLENKEVISINIPEFNIEANVNVTGIDRVITEMLSNSLRHIQQRGDDGKIIVSGYPCQDGFEVKVIDNGDGIDPIDIDRIWEAGWQQKDMNTGASGLGLSICKQTIEAHGGTIKAFSPGKNQGMEISFVIPPVNSENILKR